MSEGPKKIWTHQTVYDALVESGGTVIETEHGRYVHLYPQDVDCAILHAPGGAFDNYPLHFHPGISGWRPAKFRKLMPAIQKAYLEHKSKPQRDQRFIHCEVDWDRMAAALGHV